LRYCTIQKEKENTRKSEKKYKQTEEKLLYELPRKVCIESPDARNTCIEKKKKISSE